MDYLLVSTSYVENRTVIYKSNEKGEILNYKILYDVRNEDIFKDKFSVAYKYSTHFGLKKIPVFVKDLKKSDLISQSLFLLKSQ